MSHFGRALNQGRSNRAAIDYMRAASDRFRQIGTPQAMQAADLIAKNPRAFAMEAEQFGGPARMEQFYKAQAMQEQAGQSLSRSGTGNQFADQLLADGAELPFALSMAEQIQGLQSQAAERDIRNDVNGRPRYTDTGELVYGDVEPQQKDGMRIITRPDGSTEVVMGGGGSSELTRGTVTQFQKDATAADDALSRLAGIRTAYHAAGGDDALKYTTRWEDNARRLLHKLNVWEMDAGTAKGMSARTAFIARTLDNLNRTIKEITGAQMNKDEAKRIIPTQANPNMSGPEFVTMLDVAEDLITAGRDRRLYLLKRGIIGPTHDFKDKADGVPAGWDIDTFEAKREARAQALIGEYEAQFPDEDERGITQRVSDQLERELQAGVPW
jgi:hypothetical protein